MNIFEREIIKPIDMGSFERVFNKDIRSVIEAVRKYGFDIRVVGGAVRDFILGKSPRDIDFATDADPAELILIFDLEDIDYDADGISHGTVKGVFGDEKVDVTSITYSLDVDEKGHMQVVRSEGWKADAKRRDLTINSMSLDMDGNIYDYMNGLEDLKNQVIRFTPSQYAKIKKDPNIILRWFKALGYFDNPKWITKDFNLIKNNISLLAKVKDDAKTERTLGNIVGYDNSDKIFALMCNAGADKYLDINCK